MARKDNYSIILDPEFGFGGHESYETDELEEKSIPKNTSGPTGQIKNKESVIKFYAQLISEVDEHRYPPTLFGFEYSPSMFTVLKSYVVSAIAAIGYIGYSVFSS